MKTLIKHALIMAAGRGARMMPLTQHLPKAMAPYDGSTLIARSIRLLKESIEQVHVTVGYKGALLARHVVEIGIASVFDTSGRGNAWWLYHTLMRFVDEPVVVLTCDNILDLDFGLLFQDYLDRGQPPCMVVPVVPQAGLEGDYIFKDGHAVTGLDRQRKSDIYCSGIQVINPRRINEETEVADDFYDVWRQLIAKRILSCSAVYPKSWYSVDTVAQLEVLEANKDEIKQRTPAK